MTPLPWSRAIIVGASSGIGEELANQLGAGGCRVALLARREAELTSIADRINAAAGDKIATIYPRCRRYRRRRRSVSAKSSATFGGLDLIVYASGYMPKVGSDEYAIDKDAVMIDVNITGAVAWLNQAAHRFGQARTGTIVGIGSVAGDRGRRGNPVYGASKAFLDTYLEALRNRLAVKGVAVVTIKPGPVDTPMTASLGKLPGMISVGRRGKSDSLRLPGRRQE